MRASVYYKTNDVDSVNLDSRLWFSSLHGWDNYFCAVCNLKSCQTLGKIPANAARFPRK